MTKYLHLYSQRETNLDEESKLRFLVGRSDKDPQMRLLHNTNRVWRVGMEMESMVEDKNSKHLPSPEFVGDPSIAESRGSNTWMASWSWSLALGGVSEEEVRRLRL